MALRFEVTGVNDFSSPITMIKFSSATFSLILVFGAAASLPAADPPPGAAALGYFKRVINERPVASDIAPGESGNYKWFSGQWYAKPPSLDHYSTTNGVLTLSLDGDLVSAPRAHQGPPFFPGRSAKRQPGLP